MASSRRLRDLLLLAAALMLSASCAAAADFQYCNKGRHYPVKVSGVEIVPDPVVRGQLATFKISASTVQKLHFIFRTMVMRAHILKLVGSGRRAAVTIYFLDKSIAKGKLVVDVTYFIFHVHTETHDFCSGTHCPATGEFVLASEQTLPSFTPPGSYTLQMKLLGEKNEELTCISFGFSIGFVVPDAFSCPRLYVF